MSTESTPPPAADPPPKPLPMPPGHKSSSAEVSVAFEHFADQLQPHAAEHLKKLWPDLPLIDPTLLRDTIAMRLKGEAYAIYLKPAPVVDPYSHENLAAAYRDSTVTTRVVTLPDGRKVAQVGTKPPAVERAEREAHAAAVERQQQARAFWQELATLPPAERLARLAEVHRQSRATEPTLKLRPRSK